MLEELESFVEGDRLYIRIANDMPNVVKKFPDSMVDSTVKKNIILAALKCSDYVVFFPDILVKMLKEFPVSIKAVQIILKKPSKAAIPVTQVLHKGRPLDMHEFFAVQSLDRSAMWYLDATGPQYNMTTPCLDADE
ncbi:hypothetical protein NX059_007156 [Plenodomus lindquistii]|nr:hypothetical protein NX059_007156 [Plenodomus lindquistii]